MNSEFFIHQVWPKISYGASQERMKHHKKLWKTLLESLQGEEKEALSFFVEQEKGKILLEGIFGSSPYLSSLILNNPDWLRENLYSRPEDFIKSCTERLESLRDHFIPRDQMMQEIRRAKSKLCLGLALGDISGVLDLEKLTQSLSVFAEQAIETALYYAFRHNIGRDIDLKHCAVSVIGLGKLGGGELNYSSDIDLIIFYHLEKFAKFFPEYEHDKIPSIMKRIVLDVQKILSEVTAHGYVFRMDLRLRPDPASTPLAIEIHSALLYYESRARNWERAAFIKARIVAGDIAFGKEFLDHLTPFIWRTNLDYAGLQDIYDIRHQITSAHGRSNTSLTGYNVKLGRGGIRSIEFYVQMLQMVWGGKIPDLRQRSTLNALKALHKKKFIDTKTTRILTDSYRFLRHCEHRLQMVEDRQTHSLPDNDAELEGFSAFMGYKKAQDFYTQITDIINQIESCYQNETFFHSEKHTEHNLSFALFTGGRWQERGVEELNKFNFSDSKTVAHTINRWQQGHYRALQTERARSLMSDIFPSLILAFSKTAAPDRAITSFDHFLTTIPAGIQWLSLFKAHPHLLDLLASIMGDAPLIAETLSQFPYLIEAVLEPTSPLLTKNAFLEECRTRLHYAQNFEKKLDAARDWNRERKFLIYCDLLRGNLDTAKALHYFSAIAQSVVSSLFEVVQEDFERQYGKVEGGEFIVIALGRLGSFQMLPHSDLDLVCLYDYEGDHSSSHGEKKMGTAIYYQRLTQRLLTALSTQTSRGGLYEIDLRLRPFGNAGPLALKRKGFLHYYKNDARLWEFLALSRARPLAGSKNLLRLTTKDIRTILKTTTKRFDLPTIQNETAMMREKIAQTHQGKKFWDIKHQRGGAVDVEFILQYLQLIHPDIRPSPDFTRVIKRLEQGRYLNKDQAETLEQAYHFSSQLLCILQLIFKKDSKPIEFTENQRTLFKNLSGGETFQEIEDKMKKMRTKIRKIYDDVITKV